MLSSILGSRGRRQFAQRLFQSQAHLCCVMQLSGNICSAQSGATSITSWLCSSGLCNYWHQRASTLHELSQGWRSLQNERANSPTSSSAVRGTSKPCYVMAHHIQSCCVALIVLCCFTGNV